jgi:hypothetical protein
MMKSCSVCKRISLTLHFITYLEIYCDLQFRTLFKIEDTPCEIANL